MIGPIEPPVWKMPTRKAKFRELKNSEPSIYGTSRAETHVQVVGFRDIAHICCFRRPA